MKRQDKDKLHQLSLAELETRRQQLSHQLAHTALLLKSGKEKNLKSAKNLRYQIAYINTLITQMKLKTTT